MRDGDDAMQIFSEIGKILPNKLIQLLTTKDTKVKYLKKHALQ